MTNFHKLANAIRALSMDAVQLANSGHPGMPLGMADIAEVLWNDFLKHNPKNPNWYNRDRFVLSNGHGSMLLYSLLHLTGYSLSIEDLKQFRQLHSKTPGHPEVGETPGVETTTGPLGQGLANAVGMAIAEKRLANEFNRENFNIIDHHTYAFIGDGCLMEGISHEVCSLAGTFALGKLIVFYDDNQISIDGNVKGWLTDNTAMRFNAYGWQVIQSVDGHNREAIKHAIELAHSEAEKPTLICCQTTIGWGSPNLAGTAAVHGAPLGDEEIALTREKLHWQYPPFFIPEDIYQQFDATEKGKQLEDTWQETLELYQKEHPALAKEFLRRMQGKLSSEFHHDAKQFIASAHAKTEAMATRAASQVCLNAYSKKLPELLGGSADLTGSNKTLFKEAQIFSRDNPTGNYIHYGVREFGMSAICNGIALYGGLIPYCGTFLTFSDYAKNAIRLAALMKQQVIFVYSHDSLGLGEDGPTHQPVEHIASLRLIPGLNVWRPCDLSETAYAWYHALQLQGPSAILLSRQSLPAQKRSHDTLNNIANGGYILKDTADKVADIILIATGSEVALAIQCSDALEKYGISARVVSMPCLELFKAKPEEYQQEVLPIGIKRLVIEAGSPDNWQQYLTANDDIVAINQFGLSAPYQAVFAEFGFTQDNIVNKIRNYF